MAICVDTGNTQTGGGGHYLQSLKIGQLMVPQTRTTGQPGLQKCHKVMSSGSDQSLANIYQNVF